MGLIDREHRLSVLRNVMEGNAPYPIELLLRAGFPDSAAYPPYWSSTNPGARLALELDCRVVFSSKAMTIKLVPLTKEERSLQHIRIARARRADQEKTRKANELVRSIIDAARCPDPESTLPTVSGEE